MSLEDIFGKAIYTYTRQQALEDGVLIDITDAAKEAGFKMPIAISLAAWEKCVHWSEEDAVRTGAYQDQSGRLWDILWMLHVAIKGGSNVISQRQGAPGEGSEIVYNFLCVPRDLSKHSEPTLHELKCICGPNDDMTPCMTIMLVKED